VVAAIGNGAGFKQGRDFGAWLGLVPRQESTGDRTILGKISKRGNRYVRTLFVQAAHVILVKRPRAAMQGLMPWIDKALKRMHRGDRARQQAGAHRLGRARTRAHLSAAELGPCRMKEVRLGSPRGWTPPPPPPSLVGCGERATWHDCGQVP
jgi:hypothetical protein